VPEEAFDELDFVRRNPFDTNGDWKTGIGESADFRFLVALVGPTARPPFLPRSVACVRGLRGKIKPPSLPAFPQERVSLGRYRPEMRTHRDDDCIRFGME